MRSISLILIVAVSICGWSFRNKGNEVKSLNTIAPDTLILPKVDSNYAVKLLIPGKFKIEDIKFDANTMPWYALMKNGSNFSIQKHSPEQSKIVDSD